MTYSSEIKRPKLLIFIVAYHAERTIKDVIDRIPDSMGDSYDVEILIIDDASSDRTFELGRAARHKSFAIRVLQNPVNQGYGGNQKLGYHYAIQNGFDYVLLLHGDGQYAPEFAPNLIEPLRLGQADAVFGTRFNKTFGALKGGMPLYKFVGNRILTWYQNRMLGMNLSEFHSGYRAYRVAALAGLPFDLNSQDFDFDSEIIIQLRRAQMRIVETPIPTYYGDEISRVNGLKYAWRIAVAGLQYRAQNMGIFYDQRFDLLKSDRYVYKREFDSTHRKAFELIPRGARVLDLGGGVGQLARDLRLEKKCWVAGSDTCTPLEGAYDAFAQADLEQSSLAFNPADYDYVLMLDVIEHLKNPEAFISTLRSKLGAREGGGRLIISTGNVAFLPVRIMLMLGQFNYGPRGILDITHTRLFTLASLRRLLTQNGFEIEEIIGVPPPYPLFFGARLSGWLLALHRLLIRLRARLFSFQIMIVANANPTLDSLLEKTVLHSDKTGGAQFEREKA